MSFQTDTVSADAGIGAGPSALQKGVGPEPRYACDAGHIHEFEIGRRCLD
jgi:hypothetical protein